MDEKTIIQMLLNKMLEEGLWFTTKNDPTYEEASSYYELDQYGDLTDKAQSKIVKEIEDKLGDGAVEIDDAIDIWINEAGSAYKIAYTDQLVTEFEPKPIVDQIEAYEGGKIEESVKARLKEENNKSLNLISSKLTDSDFDADSESGQIVLRTSELFNSLSDSGYDVQVAFDNGDSQSTILLGQQGAQIEITINNATSPLKAFVSGNFEINNDNLTILTDVLEKLGSI